MKDALAVAGLCTGLLFMLYLLIRACFETPILTLIMPGVAYFMWSVERALCKPKGDDDGERN